MITTLRSVAMASSLTLLAFGATGFAAAEDPPKDSKVISNECADQGGCMDQKPDKSRQQQSQDNQNNNDDADQPQNMKLRKKPTQDNQNYTQDVDQPTNKKLRKQRSQGNENYTEDGDQPEGMKLRKQRSAESSSGWKYNSKRHERRRYKNNQYRFYFGGFYYPQQYWAGDEYGMQSYRVGCGEGRRIVADNGYNRVRTIECNGSTFTYLGRRHGDTFRVLLNSRSGRIVGREGV